ncbi:hypothetical protein COU57_05230 [Candidatus Pacearchaeota archaeon CG10_big_fil_rev_8_21_14_0_10_32_14]|nr:MAG: hypothetical protein COU57_05230 [Candidatus Pacearchaeota archaeon CG10_big_fil_rev_8_21_14_0_10_32_14]
MKALSLKQPYAELIICGKKKIELRKWNTNYRGEFYIHASKIPDIKALRKFGYKKEDLPLGCIVGKAEITSVKKLIIRMNIVKIRSCTWLLRNTEIMVLF